MLDIWSAWRGGGLAPGHLPFAGGTADQPACVMACLRVMEAAYQAITPPPPGDDRPDAGATVGGDAGR